MMRSRIVTRTIIVGALVGALAIGGCARNDNNTGDGGGSRTAPLRVGLLVNKSGPLPSGEETAVPVMRAWAKAVNAKGGVASRPVEIVVFDTKGDAPTATAAVQKMTSQKDIVAAVVFDAATENVVADAITRAGLPVIGGMGYAPNAWGAMKNWLPLTTSIPSIFNMGMVLGHSLGAHRTALTICAEIAGCAAATPVVRTASERLGMTYVSTYNIAAAAPDFTAECLKIINTQVDYVMLGAATTAAALRVARDCRTQGYSGQWGLFGGVIFPKVMRANDPGVPLGLALNSFPWFADAPLVRAYRDMMQAGGLGEEIWGDLHATAAYATMELFGKTLNANAARLPATPSRRDIVEVYGTIRDETLDGLLSQPITFRVDQPNALVTCYWFGSYQGGTFSDADLGKPVCDPPSLKS